MVVADFPARRDPGDKSTPLPTKRLLQAFTGSSSERPPFWFMRQAGRYLPEYRALRREAPDFMSFCFSPDLTVEATLQPLRRYGMDGAILFSDILVIPHALGCSVRFVENQGPVLEAVRSSEDLTALSSERIDEILEPVFETLRRLSKEIPAETALIGFAGAPWTVATYMVEGKRGNGWRDGTLLGLQGSRWFRSAYRSHHKRDGSLSPSASGERR